MNLLVITQSVDLDNPVLAFFHAWILEFSKKYEKVTVICLTKGRYDLPQNVNVLSLGKDRRAVGSSLFGRISYIFYFYKFIISKNNEYDAVFVHMNPIYAVLGGAYWNILNKPVGLWYTHRNVDLKLRIAEKFSNIIFTASKEGFQLPSNKLKIVGHGIEVEKFYKIKRTKEVGIEPYNMIHVGRITPIKDYETLIETALILKKEWKCMFRISLIGETVTKEDMEYKDKISLLIKDRGLEDVVVFKGAVPAHNIGDVYGGADLSLNLVPTGGMDKVVLESIVSGTPVISSNATFMQYFGPHFEIFNFRVGNKRELAEKIMNFFTPEGLKNFREEFRDKVLHDADVSILIDEIYKGLKK